MLAYCDYIANVIRTSLREDTSNPLSLVDTVTPVIMDLHPDEGYMLSTKKTVEVFDKNGKKYLVTVEEV
jgi:hypothetical protein